MISVDRQSFSRELAPARTFGVHEADFAGLQAMGLIRGGSVENAMRAGRRRNSERAAAFSG